MTYRPQRMKFGIFMAPFHRVGENPTLALKRDLSLIEHLTRSASTKHGSASTTASDANSSPTRRSSSLLPRSAPPASALAPALSPSPTTIP